MSDKPLPAPIQTTVTGNKGSGSIVVVDTSGKSSPQQSPSTGQPVAVIQSSSGNTLGVHGSTKYFTIDNPA